MATCQTCNGAGAVTSGTACPRCKGTGELVGFDDDDNEQIALCPDCEFGVIFAEERCPTCGGKGEVWPSKDDPFKGLR